VHELRLDSKQADVVEDLQKRQREQASLFNDSMAVVRQSMVDELRKPQPDLDRVRTLLDQEAEVMRQRRMAEADLFGEFMNVLSPEQRQNLERLRERGPPQPGRPLARLGDAMRRFDRNGNGRLDLEELQTARQELENLRRKVVPHSPPRPPLWPWFDADGDGELNDAERAEMDQFMREHRPPPPPPRDADGQPPRLQHPPGGLPPQMPADVDPPHERPLSS